MITDDTAQKMCDFLNSTKIDLSELIQTHFSTLTSYFIQHTIKTVQLQSRKTLYRVLFLRINFFKLKICKYINILNIHLLYQ